MEEKRERKRLIQIYMVFGLLLSCYVSNLSALSITVNDMECVYEYVLYEGDTISGNFVVVDHEIFWSSDHPGIDFTVCSFYFPPFSEWHIYELFRPLDHFGF